MFTMALFVGDGNKLATAQMPIFSIMVYSYQGILEDDVNAHSTTIHTKTNEARHTKKTTYWMNCFILQSKQSHSLLLNISRRDNDRRGHKRNMSIGHILVLDILGMVTQLCSLCEQSWRCTVMTCTVFCM